MIGDTMDATEEQDDLSEWIEWRCPQCYTTNCDPGWTFETSCNCGAIVQLTEAAGFRRNAELVYMSDNTF